MEVRLEEVEIKVEITSFNPEEEKALKKLLKELTSDKPSSILKSCCSNQEKYKMVEGKFGKCSELINYLIDRSEVDADTQSILYELRSMLFQLAEQWPTTGKCSRFEEFCTSRVKILDKILDRVYPGWRIQLAG